MNYLLDVRSCQVLSTCNAHMGFKLLQIMINTLALKVLLSWLVIECATLYEWNSIVSRFPEILLKNNFNWGTADNDEIIF